jgi:V8-like Glu-specific endopeptidase
MLRTGIIALAAAYIVIAPAHAEQDAIKSASDFNCTTSYPAVAVITNLSTGLGISQFSYDATTDNAPPCTGTLPTNPPPVVEYPSNAIPQLAKVLTNSGQCSGNFIAQNAVITAAHCVFDRVTKKYATGVRMIRGYQNGDKPYGILDGATILTFQGYTTSNMAAHDIAVIKSSGVGLAQIYGLYGMSAYNVANCSNQAKWYTEPHYSPQVNNNEAQAGADGPIVACVQGMVATTLPLLPGSSGSAVIDIYSRTVFAVHSQYSLSPAGSYNAVLTHAKICAIWAFLDTDQINGPVANCFAGN